jgi:hypothetical protein
MTKCLLFTSEGVVQGVERDAERRNVSIYAYTRPRHTALALLGDRIFNPESPERSVQRPQVCGRATVTHLGCGALRGRRRAA